jgi:hypothetical protein
LDYYTPVALPQKLVKRTPADSVPLAELIYRISAVFVHYRRP